MCACSRPESKGAVCLLLSLSAVVHTRSGRTHCQSGGSCCLPDSSQSIPQSESESSLPSPSSSPLSVANASSPMLFSCLHCQPSSLFRSCVRAWGAGRWEGQAALHTGWVPAWLAAWGGQLWRRHPPTTHTTPCRLPSRTRQKRSSRLMSVLSTSTLPPHSHSVFLRAQRCGWVVGGVQGQTAELSLAACPRAACKHLWHKWTWGGGEGERRGNRLT